MTEDFVVRKNFGVARYYRTSADAFKGADYANPYSYYKKDHSRILDRLLGLCIPFFAFVIFGLVFWRIYYG
jgi:hypothetical protein